MVCGSLPSSSLCSEFPSKKLAKKKERECFFFPFLLSLGMDTKFEITKIDITKFEITNWIWNIKDWNYKVQKCKDLNH